MMDNLDNCVDNNDSDVRIEQQLRIKIGEAKNLMPRNGSNSSSGLRDCYCVISLDREQIYRTCSTVERTLNPFFGEEFQFEIPRRFRNLAIYLYDRERSVNNKDKVMGKVAIKRDDLSKYHNKESWFPIKPVDPDSEVQGKIHVDIKLDHCFKPGAHQTQPKVAVRVIDCNDLGVINGCCDPYVIVSLYNGLIRQEAKRTKIKKKTVNPHYEEIFYFDIPIRGQNHDRNSVRSLNNVNVINNNNLELRLSVMHDGNGMFGSAFLGEVKIPLNDIDLSGHNAWYLLQPRDSGRSDDRVATDLGSLRLKIDYTFDYVFSSRFYETIRKLILISPEIKPISSSTAYILGELVSNKVDAAQPLVKIFMHYKKIIPLIKVLAEAEISKVT
ncbi:unnamed protein product [Medioppia subpectinata]|uniref:C2 domain-containing protein n=1 Tax=Medioppia subpectinata TaxID=1979941 RepID=A0A7R9Q5C7_9ACAR|nr:unnamed protein product [Medioppia subpectinata]CAG2113621.1 unnamed protein product [Medioppia subpectinata]